MTKILVTGGTGFTGSHLVGNLIASGDQVRVLARSSARAREILPPEVEIVEGDVTSADAVGRAVRGQEIVYHLAAAFREPGIPNSRYREVHVDGTRLLLEAAHAQGVRRFVHCSTIGVHGHVDDPPADENTRFAPGDIYQQTKAEGEQLALEFQQRHGLPLSVARPATIYGPGDLRLLKLFRMIARRRFIMLGSGKVNLHMVYVDDLVQGFRLLAEREEAVGEVFILAGERYLPLSELTAVIAGVVGVPRPKLRVPVTPFYAAGALCELICIPLGLDPPIYRRRVAFFTKNRAFSIEKAKRMLGFRPRVDVETGVRRTADWYRAEGYLG